MQAEGRTAPPEGKTYKKEKSSTPASCATRAKSSFATHVNEQTRTTLTPAAVMPNGKRLATELSYTWIGELTS